MGHFHVGISDKGFLSPTRNFVVPAVWWLKLTQELAKHASTTWTKYHLEKFTVSLSLHKIWKCLPLYFVRQHFPVRYWNHYPALSQLPDSIDRNVFFTLQDRGVVGICVIVWLQLDISILTCLFGFYLFLAADHGSSRPPTQVSCKRKRLDFSVKFVRFTLFKQKVQSKGGTFFKK